MNRFRKIRLPSWSVRNPGDQRDSCLKNAGRFIQSSRADNAHEAGDRSLSAYLMLVQQRRRVCVEAHIDCHPCRHPSPLLHHRCPPPPPPLPPSCTPRHPVRPVRCIERATTFHRIYRSTEAPGATRFGRQVYQQLVTTTSAGDINSDSIVVSRSAAPAGINIKLTLRSSSPSPRSIELRVSSPACSRRHPPDSFPIIRTIHRIFARNLSS